MAKMQRRKGKRGERELAGVFRASGFEARTGRQHRGGPDSPDIMVEDKKFLHVECKRTERLRLYDAIDQARADAGEDQIPIVCHRRNARRWLVVMDLEHFHEMLREFER